MASSIHNPVDVSLFIRKADKADTFQQPVMNLLSDGRWHSAQSICEAIPELDKRTIRTIRDRSRGAIIGGQAGYRLTRSATKDEIDHYIRLCYKNMRDYQQTAVHVENFRAKRRL